MAHELLDPFQPFVDSYQKEMFRAMGIRERTPDTETYRYDGF